MYFLSLVVNRFSPQPSILQPSTSPTFPAINYQLPNYQPLSARLLPFEEGFDSQGKQCQERQQAGHGEGGGRVVFVVELFDAERHGVSLPGDVAGNDRDGAELAHSARVAENDAVNQAPLH